MTIDLEELREMVEQGYVRKVVHPSGLLELFNYSEKCTYEGMWNDTTRQCRGLILDLNGNVVARPFRKFFNYGEPNAPELDLDAPVIVTDKADGSCGIRYLAPDGEWAIATRGSFTSDQAIHATALLRTKYAKARQMRDDLTYLFEVVYAANRIVVDYGDMDDLILLDIIDTETGEGRSPTSVVGYDPDNPPWGYWPGPRVEVFEHHTLRAALEAPPRPGQEGLVVFFPGSGERLKIKQADYVAIHRLVFGLTARRIWENAGVHDLNRIGLGVKQIGIALQMDTGDAQGIIDAAPSGNWMEELLRIVPEEFATWATATAERITGAVDAWENNLGALLSAIAEQLQIENLSRKEWAAAIQKQPVDLRGALFAALDGKEVRPFAWRAIRPEHETYKREE